MARKDKYDYFESFVKISGLAVRYAEEVVGFLESHYDEDTNKGSVNARETLRKLEELHDIEDESDEIVSEVTEHLVTEFMTPIEREDVIALVEELDDVVDELDDVLQRMYMYNVELVTIELVEMAHLVLDTTRAVQAACESFTHFKKSRSIRDSIRKIHDLEDQGDRTYIRSVHNIYVHAMEGGYEYSAVAYGLTGVLAALEKCCDACEAAGDTIVLVIMKNS